MIGDFNSDVNQSCMKAFCKSYNLFSLIKEPTCYKNSKYTSCIDLILTNSPHSFQNSCVTDTGLSDFHKMTLLLWKQLMKSQNLQLSITETIKISVMAHFERFFWRNWLQKILPQIVMVSRNFHKFALIHWTYLLLVSKYTPEEIICLPWINP